MIVIHRAVRQRAISVSEEHTLKGTRLISRGRWGAYFRSTQVRFSPLAIYIFPSHSKMDVNALLFLASPSRLLHDFFFCLFTHLFLCFRFQNIFTYTTQLEIKNIEILFGINSNLSEWVVKKQ
jgi:hypothetical protein